nr:apoptosis-inducing factor 3-like [Cherax quadricarinatus]
MIYFFQSILCLDKSYTVDPRLTITSQCDQLYTRISSQSKASIAEDMIEAVVCRADELPEEGMKTFEVEGGKVLVVHHKGQLMALGTTCSHYGAPLEKGSVCDGKIRCPWHGACFSLTTDLPPNGDIEILQGVSAEKVNTEEKEVVLNSGEKVPYNKLFIATGAKPRVLGCPGDDLPDVFVIRTPEDANAVAAAASGKHTVIVGTSFIGMEAAAYLASNNRAASVTVIGNTSVPFERSLGLDVGKRIQEMFEEQGVRFFNNAGVTEFTDENGKLSGVLLDTEEILNAGSCWWWGVGYLETSVPGVFCGGDIASFPLFTEDGASVTISHWQVALGHGRTAALNMLDQNSAVRSVPFFWTVLFGKSLRYTGYGIYDDVIIGGDLENLSFIAYYCRGDRVVALASLGKDPAVAKYANMLQQGKFLTKEEVVEDKDIALKLTC